MIKRILTTATVLSLTTTASIFFLSANADEVKKVENKNSQTGGIPIEITVKGYMADEWLAEHDEFDITFENNGEKTYGFFNKDNNFERTIELYEGVEYNVTLSDEFEGFVVQGFDETFKPDKDNTSRMITVLPSKDKKAEKSERSDGLKLGDKLFMSDEELVEYKEQRKLVQEFIDLTEKYGLCDDTNEYWQTLSEGDKKFILEESPWCEKYCKNTETEEEYVDVLNVEYGKTDNEILKRRFAFEMLYAQIYYCCHEMTMSNDEYINRFCKGTNNSNAMDNYYGNYDSVVKSIMDYDQSYWDKYHDIPNLYTVYLDIINGVEYEATEKDVEESSSVNEGSENEAAIEKDDITSSSFSENDKSEVTSETNSKPTSNSNMESSTPKKTIVDALKNNIITIILAVVLGGALLYIRNIKKNGNKKNDDY